jgi:hypothetical protein
VQVGLPRRNPYLAGTGQCAHATWVVPTENGSVLKNAAVFPKSEGHPVRSIAKCVRTLLATLTGAYVEALTAGHLGPDLPS